MTPGIFSGFALFSKIKVILRDKNAIVTTVKRLYLAGIFIWRYLCKNETCEIQFEFSYTISN